MTKPGLPPPMTYEMQYLAAILDELRAIRALLAMDGPPEPSAIVEAEPEPTKRRKRATKGGEV